jgi:hypothetical protein
VHLVRCFTSLLVFLFLLVPKQNAIAQTSIYGSVAVVNYGINYYNGSTIKGDTAGLIGGAFYNFPIQSRLTAGLDFRGSFGIGSGGGGLGAAALRIAFVPERVALRPYFQLGGGVATTTFHNGQTTRYTSGGLELAGGLDVRLNNSFDLRAIELGAVAGGTHQSVGSAFVDAGLVYHLRKRPRTP